MIKQDRLQAFGTSRLPLRAAVLVGGKAGIITGRSFSQERYDVMLEADSTIWHSIPREQLEVNWKGSRR